MILNEIINELKYRNEVLFYFGLICLVLAFLCLVLVWVVPMQVLGTSAWLKPFKFFLSTAIFIWTMDWYLHYLPLTDKIYYYSWTMVVLFTLEDGYILAQAVCGQTSHFNITSTYNRMMWAMMMVCALGISIYTIIIGTGFFTQPLPELSQNYLWGIRLGLIFFLVFSLEGMVMGARMAHTVGYADGAAGMPITNWSKGYGDLRIAHFLGMHALQILPIAAFYFIHSSRGVLIFSFLYLITVCGIFIQAMLGKPFLTFFR